MNLYVLIIHHSYTSLLELAVFTIILILNYEIN